MSNNGNNSRRLFLRNAGILVALPALESLLPANAFAQATGRSRFIGVFAPNGAYMPDCADGDWTFGGALSPFSGELRNNVLLVRGLRKISRTDLHWANCAGFLSAKDINVSSANTTVCGQSLDQTVADKYGTPIRSIHVGWKDEIWIGTDHDSYSNTYLNTIAWREANKPLAKTTRPIDVYNSIFATNQASQSKLAFMLAKKKSVLDTVYDQAKALESRVPASDKAKLQSYFTTVREVENDLAKPRASCSVNIAAPPLSAPYMDHFKLMHKMIALAMKCGLTNAATIQYDTGVGDTELVDPSIGMIHHEATHHGHSPAKIAALQKITRRHTTLFADLVTQLKEQDVLKGTLALLGSNMADGNLHGERNLPVLLAGENTVGQALRFGQEIGSAGQPLPYANLLLEIAQQVGLSQVTQMGEGGNVSTGALSSIRA